MTDSATTEKPTADDLLVRIKCKTSEHLQALRSAAEAERKRLQADLLKVDPPEDVDLPAEEAVEEVDAQAQLYEGSI
jgi:hypothetical protein